MSSWHVDQLKFAFGIGGYMSFYGVVGLIVWVLGDKMGMATSSRVVVIVLVLLTMPFTMLGGYVVSRRRKKKEAKEAAEAEKAAESSAPQQQAAAAAPILDDVNAGAEEVVQFLKASNLGEGVYGLPWYFVAGAPKSGKSSLVIGSNLDFQTTPSQRQSEQKIVSPTRAVDWRVTTDAVFIDTAGRYQREGTDGDEWSSLVETIKKQRPNRPIDGFVLTINASKILESDERQLEEMAKTLRTRLDDAQQRLKVKFPVYLVFTNADAIEGFFDSFSVSQKEGQNLVWGATIPIEKSDNAQAEFESEYELLQGSLLKRRVLRLSAPFPPVRQLKIFNFPLHFGSARRKFASFVSSLFRPNPFSDSPFFRGFYFVANPVKGARIQGVPETVGDTFFTERLFRDVILRDRDLVRTMVDQRARAPIGGWLLTTFLALVTLGFLTLSGVSLVTNKQMLADASDRGQKLLTIVKADAGKNVLAKNEGDTRREVSSTEDLRDLLVKLDDYERNGAPLYMRFGMYSGNDVYLKSLLPIYINVVEQRFKAPAMKRLEADLRQFASSSNVVNASQLSPDEEKSLGKNYDLLKAYLMLTGDFKDKAEASHLISTLKDYWIADSKVPGDLKETALAQLEFWAKQANRGNEINFPRISADQKLVADARKKLQAFPAVYRYYKRKVTDISKEVDDKVGATTAVAILARNGGDSTFVEGTYTVPSAYTSEGFKLMKKAIAEADQKLSEDDWVMGEEGKNAVRQSTDAGKIEERYYRDYADHWRNFVKAVRVKPYKNKDDASAALQAFSSANSPLKIILNEVSKNANLSEAPPEPGWIDWIVSYFKKKEKTETGGNTDVEKDFRPLSTFVGGAEKKDGAPIDKYQTEVGKLYKAFNGLSADKIREIAQNLANDKDDDLKIRAVETSVSNLIKVFQETPAGQEIATLLLQPIGNLKELLGADVKSQVAKSWVEQIFPAAKDIEKGFPFEDSQTEADLTKLAAFLNPADGKLSRFYDDKLKKYFEESNGQLKVKDGSELKFTPEFVAYLNNAFALRKALFGSNPTPAFEYEFQLKPVKDALIELTIDGQKTTSEGTASLKLKFPAGTATETGVLMSLLSTAEAASSGSATPAASPSAAANTTAPKFQQSAPESGGSVMKFPGAWGLFRFVDAGSPQKQATGEYLLNYKIGGKSVTATVKPSGGDLFNKEIFRAVRAPQNIAN